MSFFHHGTIRKYTGAILQFFNDMEVQYKRSDDILVTKPVPLKYSTREKTRVLDEVTSRQLIEGNFNVLPRANLAFISAAKSEQRTTGKSNKINPLKTDTKIAFSYNSVPYEFLYDIVVQCRGMNECTQILEQVAPSFNPIVYLDIWDGTNLNEPTRTPLLLQGIAIESDEYDEITHNLITLTLSLSLFGNLYPPIQEAEKIKQFKIGLHEIVGEDQATQVALLEWDVDNDGNVIDP